jgi:hypothetical protein
MTTHFLKPKRDCKEDFGMVLLDLQHGRMGEMVVMAMADNNKVDLWYPLDVNWLFCISFWSHPREWRAPLFENGIK